MPSVNTNFPLVHLETSLHDGIPTVDVVQKVTNALTDSGFLIVKSPELPINLQTRAINAASHILNMDSSSAVITHPSDPKVYVMLHGIDFDIDVTIDPTIIQDLQEWYGAVRSTKDVLLRCIAIGLGMDDADFFANLHSEHNDSLRLLRYHRCWKKWGLLQLQM